MLGKRQFLMLSGAALLAGCGGAAVGPSRPLKAAPAMRAVPNPGFTAWLADFRGRAVAKGIQPATLSRGLRGAGFLPDVVERDRNQAEFKRSLEDYLSLVASDSKIQDGRAAFRQNRKTLSAIEARYGVPAEIVAAIWGVESNFGTRRGDIPTISALATLAYDGRRGAFFEGQLIAALKILQAGDVTPARMTGSWAGAMGHTQFIPTSYLAYAVDFTGDGRRDIWSNDPTDALASAAAYLDRSGWQTGTTWGHEDTGGALQPDPGGPRFTVTGNFRVIKRYNNSDNYAIAVGYLADRIAGKGPLRQGFGPDRYGLRIGDRKRLQQRLNAAGYDVGKADGVLGNKTKAAISRYQRAQGMVVTGAPSQALLLRLG